MKNIMNHFNKKRAILLTACIIAILALSGTGMAFAATSISLDEAKNIALTDAGVSAADATFTKAEQDRDDGMTIYELEFYTASAEYEYEINAATGAILDKEVEARKTSGNTGSSSGNTSGSTSGSGTSGSGGTSSSTTPAITLEEAKAVALSDAGVSTADVTFTKAKSDVDDGISVYDIEFYTSTTEYEYEINATTGAILDKDVEARKNSSNTGSSSGNTSGSTSGSGTSGSGGTSGSTTPAITLEEAKAVALSDAGVSTADVTFTKAKSDVDDGISVYDIEFYTSTTEYEYEIDAATGAILDKDVEPLKNNGNTDNSSNSGSNTGSSSSSTEITPYSRGDADGNSRINTSDALFVLKAHAKLSTLTTEAMKAADVDSNNVINTADALFILKYYVNLISQFPN